IASRRWQGACVALHWVCPKASDRLRPFRNDQLLERIRQALGKLLLGFLGSRETVVVGAVRVKKTGERQAKAFVIFRPAGHAYRDACRAVIALLPRDNFTPLGFTLCVPVVPYQLYRGVIGL